MLNSNSGRLDPEDLSQSVSTGHLLARTDAFEIRRIQPAEGPALAIKCSRESSFRTRESLRRQFNALQDIAEKTSGTLRDSVPLPLLLLDDMLIMTALPGVRLTKFLRQHANSLRGWQNVDLLKTVGYSIGKWLNIFQSTTELTSRVFSAAEYLSKLESALFLSKERGISESILADVYRQTEDMCAACDGKTVPIAACHGEFLPQNILIFESQVGVVDFDTYVSESSIYKDVATFLAYIALLFSKRRYSARAMAAMAEGFLSGNARELHRGILKLELMDSILHIATNNQLEPLESGHRRYIENTLTTVANGGFPGIE